MSRICPLASMYASPRFLTTSAEVWLVRVTSKSRPSIVRSVKASSSALYATTVPATRSEKVKCMFESMILPGVGLVGASALLRDEDDDAAGADGAPLALVRGLRAGLGHVRGRGLAGVGEDEPALLG